MSLSRLFSSWTEHLQRGANVKAVFGEPIEAQGRTIIPVARVGFGFGAKEFKVDTDQNEDPDQDKDADQDKAAAPSAGGGGGGMARPVGVLDVTPEGTRFIPTRSNGKLYAGLFAGVLVGLWLGRGRKK